MRYIREYKENFDLDFAMVKIKNHFNLDSVTKMFDTEVKEWIDDNWKEGFETELDWYVDHNNGEAQDLVINQIISWYEKEFNKDLSQNDRKELVNSIQNEYKILKY